jgi:Mg2+-importing ATPase
MHAVGRNVIAAPSEVVAAEPLGIGKSAFWNQPLATTLTDFGASAEGLSAAEADGRLRRYGPNDATTQRRSHVAARFVGRFRNPLVILLLVASALSALTGDVASFAIVVTIVVASVLLDFIQETRAQGAVEALQKKVALRTDVRRDGVHSQLAVAALVPGDVVTLSAGDLVPADGRLMACRDFFVDQALLTGESFPVEKHAADPATPVMEISDATNAALAGSSVISGSATLLVCRTGRATALGALAGTLIAKPPPNAFESGLRRFTALILRITVVLVLLVMAESLFFHRPWLQSLMFALALAVALAPELLPMIVTVTLSRGAVRLARQRVIVKWLPAIHNLGAMDVLCTDKTGTLTEARIKLVRHVGPTGEESERVFELAFLNSHFETGLRSPLDDAILEHAKFDAQSWRKIDEVPFDFERRRVSVLLQKNGGRLLIVKGAPEDILRLSTHLEAADGTAQPMTPAMRAALGDRFEQLGADGMRALAIATREVGLDHGTAIVDDETELTFAGFAAFLDPPKASAAPALRALAAAGVAVKVLTGDNERVARHLVGELGLPEPDIITGDELAAMSEAALLGRLARANLFCRVTPPQKLRVLLALKRTGQSVGFLGDGINDAPALHAADVGISVDSAADVAKSAAQVILLEPDLGVLHDGVMEGRRTVVNVNKYILMASSANLGNIISMVLAGLILPFLPLLPIQVLLTNLIYDGAQLGLPMDHVDPESVEKPVHWDIRLIERFMLVVGPVSTVFDVLTFGVLLLLFHAGEMLFRTGWFVESLVTQCLMIFAVRTRRHLFASKPHPTVAALAFGAVALTVVLPFLPVGVWFHFVAPPAPYFGFLLLVVGGFLVTTELMKRLFYARLFGRAVAS